MKTVILQTNSYIKNAEERETRYKDKKEEEKHG